VGDRWTDNRDRATHTADASRRRGQNAEIGRALFETALRNSQKGAARVDVGLVKKRFRATHPFLGAAVFDLSVTYYKY
jgi:hypothetical protein